MPERTNGAVLKTAGPDEGLVGSNPTPPASELRFAQPGLRSSMSRPGWRPFVFVTVMRNPATIHP